MTSLQEFKDLCLQHGIEQSKVDAFFTTVEKNLKDKRYGLVWEEQMESVAEELKKNFPVLKEVSEREIRLDKDGKTNALIEGDNLESLTFLKNSGQKVDVIYIDPPYNTGNKDFVYNDRFVDKEDSWRHSSWLSFMNKRLKLARDLLSEKGIMFISIDDNEISQLKLLCDTIFGEKNVETMIWHKDGVSAGSGKMKITKRFRNDHEYILVIYKNKDIIEFNKPLEYTKTKNEYGNVDNDPRGNWISSEVCKSQAKSNENGKNYYEIASPTGKIWNRQWHFDKDKFLSLASDGRIYWGKDGNSTPRLKKFLAEKRPKTPTSVIGDKGTSSEGKKDLQELNFGTNQFSYPKPVSLIKHLVNLHKYEDSIVLDFFAGSGTTGHATLELNQEDGGNRQFILCTNNENNIAEEVTYERLKRVMNGYTTPKGKDVEGIPSNLKYFKVENIDTDKDIISLEDEIVENIVPFVQFKENLWNATVDTENNLVCLDNHVTIYTSNYEPPTEVLLETLIVGVKLYIHEGWVDYLDSETIRKYQIVPIPKEFFNLKTDVVGSILGH